MTARTDKNEHVEPNIPFFKKEKQKKNIEIEQTN